MSLNGIKGLVGQGFDSYNKAREEHELLNPTVKGAFRFKLEPGASARLVFLCNEPDYTVKEHFVKIAGKWQNFLCVAEEDGTGCPACDAATQYSERAYLAAYFSVMRLTALPAVENPRYPGEDSSDRSWEADWEIIEQLRRDKGQGSLVLNPVQVLIAKKGTMGILKRQHEKRGGLYGTVFDVSRSKDGQNVPSVGDLWDYEKTYSEEQIKFLNPKAEPVNYEETLRILTADQIRALYSGNSEREGGGTAVARPAASATGGEERRARPNW